MKKYAQYKDSMLPGVDIVPEHWDEVRLKYIGKLYSGLTGKKGDDFKTEPDSNTKPFIPFTNISNNERVNINNLLYVIINPQEEQNTVKTGDLFFMMSSENFEDVGKATVLLEAVSEMYLNSFCRGFRLKENNIDPLFLNYLLRAHCYRTTLMVEANGFTRINLKTGKVNDLKIILPPDIQEQKDIAQYLDRKTTQIDKLISEKQKLIELLNEERTAVINQTVTKGLNPDVPMKDSGIEWLGEIPQHWNLVKLKQVCSIKYGLGQPPKQKEGGLKIIRATNISKGSISETNMVFVDPEDIPWSREPILKEDDIIVVRSGAYTGDSAIIPKEYEGSITGYDIVLRVNAIEAKFLAYALLSTYLLDNQLFLERLRAAQPHLNAEEIGGCFLIKPSMDEQQMIIQYIKNEHVRIDYLIKKVKQEIALLKEYKTSLISEAVTGKIDVRDYVTAEVPAIAS